MNFISQNKPLVFIKIQTTGLKPNKDRIVELALIKYEVDGTIKEGVRRFNPQMPIPEEASKIHGITDEMVATKETFEQAARGMAEFLQNCDFIGFGISEFDLKFLNEEFNRAKISFSTIGRKVVDLMTMFHMLHPRNFAEAAKVYGGTEVEGHLPSKEHLNVCKNILEGMLKKYSGQDFKDKDGEVHVIENSVDSLASIFKHQKNRLDLSGNIILNSNGRPVFNFGKYKEKLVSESMMKDRSYMKYLIEETDLPSDTKFIISKIVEKAEKESAV